MTIAVENFDTSEREAPDTRAQRKAVAKHLRVSALANNAGVNNGAWNNDAYVCQRASDAINGCTRHAVGYVLFDHAPDKKRLERGRCRHRLCPHCRRQLSVKVGVALTELLTGELAAGSTLGVLTLPILHSRKDSLKQCRKALTKANADLIKRKLWRCLIAEYHRVAEVERGRKNGWNAHYHTGVKLRYSKAMAHELLRAGWLDKSLREIKIAAGMVEQDVKQWRRTAIAELKAKKKEWQSLRSIERIKKIRDARASLEAEYAKRIEPARRLQLYGWYLDRCRRDACREARLARDKELARFTDAKKQLSAAGLFNYEARQRYRKQRKQTLDAFKLAVLAADLPQSRMGFLSLSPADLEDFLREEWRIVTRALDRESYVLRLEVWKPGTKENTIRWRKKRNGKPIGEPFDKPVIAAVQELVKYTTKGHSKALKKGQVGFFQYAPHEVADYLKGVKNWHLHQSSRGWKAAQHAYEAEMKGVDRQAEHEEGGRRVSFVEVVKDLEDAVEGVLTPDQVEEVIRDGLAILDLHRSERKGDDEFSDEQERAIASHLARLLGDDRSTVEKFKLTLPQQRELARLRGKASTKGVNVDDLLLAVKDRRRELAKAQQELLDLPGDLHFSAQGQMLQMRIRQAEQKLRWALEAVRESEQRKRDEMLADAMIQQEREKLESWGELAHAT